MPGVPSAFLGTLPDPYLAAIESAGRSSCRIGTDSELEPLQVPAPVRAEDQHET